MQSLLKRALRPQRLDEARRKHELRMLLSHPAYTACHTLGQPIR